MDNDELHGLSALLLEQLLVSGSLKLTSLVPVLQKRMKNSSGLLCQSIFNVMEEIKL